MDVAWRIIGLLRRSAGEATAERLARSSAEGSIEAASLMVSDDLPLSGGFVARGSGTSRCAGRIRFGRSARRRRWPACRSTSSPLSRERNAGSRRIRGRRSTDTKSRLTELIAITDGAWRMVPVGELIFRHARGDEQRFRAGPQPGDGADRHEL